MKKLLFTIAAVVLSTIAIAQTRITSSKIHYIEYKDSAYICLQEKVTETKFVVDDGVITFTADGITRTITIDKKQKPIIDSAGGEIYLMLRANTDKKPVLFIITAKGENVLNLRIMDETRFSIMYDELRETQFELK